VLCWLLLNFEELLSQVKNAWPRACCDGSNAEAQAAGSAKSMKAKALMLAGVELLQRCQMDVLYTAYSVHCSTHSKHTIPFCNTTD